MNLKEFEGKEILSKYNLNLPKSELILKGFKPVDVKDNVIVKVQTFSGKRKKEGGILICGSSYEFEENVEELFNRTINGEEVKEVLVEELINIEREFYVCFTLDTKVRRPILVISSEGGSDIEEVKLKTPELIKTIPINILEGLNLKDIKKIAKEYNLKGKSFENFVQTIMELFEIYKKDDFKLLEINPLALSEDKFYVADCKGIIDDNALPRLDLPFERTTGLRKKTKLETEANLIDENDHKGVAGKTFVELDGNIGVLASGGGASIIAMDALINYGGRPANYTEYSGNPPAYKVEKLTRIVLSKEGLKGLWVVGGIANFTDIYKTLKAIIDVVIELGLDIPIVIRRGGPNEEKAFSLLRELAKKHDLNLHIYGRETPITLTAKYMVDEVNKIKEVNY